MKAINFLKFDTSPPTLKLPPQGEIVVFYDHGTGSIVAKDHEGATVSFSGTDGGGDPVSIVTTEGGNGSADEGKALVFSENGVLNANDIVRLNSSANAFSASFSADSAATGNRELLAPDASGTLPVVPAYVDLTAANAALESGEYWWDTTLKKLRITTA